MRIGIIGTGRIARRFVPEAAAVNETYISGIYNPHRESAERFVREISCTGPDGKTPVITDELSELFENSDAVYVASPHETHYGYIIAALNAGRHVLCEKPALLNRPQALECFELAAEKKLVLMEAIKTAYCPGYKKLLEVIREGTIGEARYISSCFTKLEKETNRELTDKRYGGSFTELGSYVLLPVFDIFGPGHDGVRFSEIPAKSGIDIFTEGVFDYGGRIADVKCGLGVKSEGSLIIGGTKGYIRVEAPWWKTEHFEAHFEDASKVIGFDEPFEGDGLRYEISEFAGLIREYDEDFIRKAGKRSCDMAQIMEMFLEKRTSNGGENR